VSLIESVPFDPERSPWDLTLVEGLEGGQAALYFRAHHVLTDGLGGIELISLLLDPPELAPEPTATPASTPMPAAVPDHESSANGDRHFGTMTMTIDVPGVMRRVVDGVNAARSIDPIDSAVRGLQRALNVANSVSRQVMVTGGPLLASSDSRSLLSRFEVLSIEDTRRTALALGGSRNDLLIAASATALGMYHERLGEQSLMLRLATPAGARRHEDGNWFVPTRLEIPTAVGRPGPQFGIVVERLSQARREPALRVVPTLASAIRRLPSRFLFPVLHAQTESVDLAATALPGLRRVRRICGATIQGLYPFGPRLGCPLNVSAFGNDGRLDIGMALDMDAIAEPQLLIDCMREAFDSFLPVAADQPPKAAKGTAAVGH